MSKNQNKIIKGILPRLRLFGGSCLLFLEGTIKNITIKWQTNQKVQLKNIENEIGFERGLRKTFYYYFKICFSTYTIKIYQNYV